ncbi:hypothetical protein [Jeotgalibacillus proteolyticus]|uniref:hypothetical protein n=1 Tax=Jeotgalibacillus proteolyticus TaxID=2082395 RepID=UPI0026C1F699
MHHKHQYDRYGRWLLTGAIIIGWTIGWLTEISHAVLSILESFLAGAIILNVIKEELPEEKESSITYFALGILSYSTLLLLLG